jgi:PAS domain S-box-containing protein
LTEGPSKSIGRPPRFRNTGELERLLSLRLGAGGSLLVGLGIAWIAIFLKAMLNELADGETGYILLMAAAVLAAWFGGLVGGLTATAVAFLLNAVIFVDTGPGGGLDRLDLVRQLLYLVVGGGVAILVASRRHAGDQLADALDEVAALADELAARDTRLEIMLAASGTGFWEWDIQKGDLTWSDAIFLQHGLTPAAQAPDFATYLQMIHPDDREAFQRSVGAAVESLSSFSLDFRLLWPDGSVHWTSAAGRVFTDEDGNAARMIGTGRDITERRRVEEERDRLLIEERRAGEFRDAFIDVISHELRTPITTILGLTQILVRPGRADDVASRTALLEDVRSESERLHRLVEDLLVLSRMERGVLVVDAEPLEPRRLLERVVAHEAAELPSLNIEIRAEPGLPIVAGEDTYVDQIVRNLLGNAAKYTPAGTHVIVDVRHEGSTVAVRFLDDGPGIPESSLAHIFELFYRDPESARTVSGSGIGLFVCASLAEAMGGRMWAARRPEGGSEFGFSLRVLEADEADSDSAYGRTGASSGVATSELPTEV